MGGMSQGGVMALHYGLSSPCLLGGVVALSAYLLRLTRVSNIGKLPLLLVHGSKDRTILESESLGSYSRLLDSPLVDYRSIRDL